MSGTTRTYPHKNSRLMCITNETSTCNEDGTAYQTSGLSLYRRAKQEGAGFWFRHVRPSLASARKAQREMCSQPIEVRVDANMLAWDLHNQNVPFTEQQSIEWSNTKAAFRECWAIMHAPRSKRRLKVETARERQRVRSCFLGESATQRSTSITSSFGTPAHVQNVKLCDSVTNM